METEEMTAQDFARFLVALLNGAGDDLHEQEDTSSGVAGPSPDPANRLPVLD